MPHTYTLLLDATIQHLEDLKARGRRFVSVSPEIFAALKAGQRRRALVERGASERGSVRNKQTRRGETRAGARREVRRPKVETRKKAE